MEIMQGSVGEQILKEILLSIKDNKNYFDISIKNKKSSKHIGTYDRRNHKITIYLLNHNSNNQLIGTAIHEYAHHFMDYGVRHKTDFWNCYFGLLEIAEGKELYTCNIDKSDKLKKITTVIKQNDLVKTKKIFKYQSGYIFCILNKLCTEIDIDFQYYTVKYLEMDWYKKKNVYLAYNSFYRNYVFDYCYKIDDEEFIQKFFNDYDLK